MDLVQTQGDFFALHEGRRRKKSASLADSESCQKVSWILHMKHRSIKFRKHPNRLVKINQHITENNAEQSDIDEGALRHGTLNDFLEDYIKPFTPRSWRTTTQADPLLEIQRMDTGIKFFFHLVAMERILVVFLRIQRKSMKEDASKGLRSNGATRCLQNFGKNLRQMAFMNSLCFVTDRSFTADGGLLYPTGCVKTTPQKTRFRDENMQEFGIQIEWTMTGHSRTTTSRRKELCTWCCVCVVKCS